MRLTVLNDLISVSLKIIAMERAHVLFVFAYFRPGGRQEKGDGLPRPLDTQNTQKNLNPQGAAGPFTFDIAF